MARRIPDPRDQTVAEVADLLHAVTHRLRREGRDGLRAEGVTWSQVRALRALVHLPAPARMSDLADHLHIARRSATSLVDELESRGLAARGHDLDDRRAVTVEVTESGQALLAAAGERRRQATVGLLDALDDGDLRTLRDLLARVAR